MPDTLKRFNRRIPLIVRLLLVLVAGIFLYGCAQSALAAATKLNGKAPACNWSRTLLFGFDLLRLDEWRLKTSVRVSLKAQDPHLDIQQFSTGGRDFWIKRAADTKKEGHWTLIYLLSEHSWMAAVN